MSPVLLRKLLLQAQEIQELERATDRGGMTIVATKIYFKDGRVKVELALAKGKKVADKRQTLREQRLAYLLYHCGLEPAEIVRYCPQEWGNVQEVIRLRRTIFMQLMKGLICEEQTFV